MAIVFAFFLIFGGKCRRVEREPARCAEIKGDFIFSLFAGDEIFYFRREVPAREV